MNTELLPSALLITALGMGLVFAAILLLWALMEAIVRLLPERALPAPEPAAKTTAADLDAAQEAAQGAAQEAAQEAALERERRRRAAAVAVAAAFALEQHPALAPPVPDSSHWQIASRTTAMRSLGSYSRPRSSGPPPKDRSQ